MQGRGRGRGRGGYGGRGGGSYNNAKQEPFELFPEITLPDPKAIPIDEFLITKQLKFENFWRSSPFYLGDGDSDDESESMHIERYSDMVKTKNKSKRESFLDYLVLRPDNFPRSLLEDSRKNRPAKKVRWNLDADMKKLDYFEKREENDKDGENATKEEDEEAEDEPEEDEAEYSDDADYNQAEYVDDDEDDYNDPDEGDDEPIY